MSPQPGETISHYRIVEKIGQGGMGVVYKALDTRLGRHVALKVLPPAFVADPDRRARFLREATTAATLSHPNIATLHEVVEEGGHCCLVLELIEGRALRSLLASGPIAPAAAVRIASQIAEGMHAAHAARVVHRDLKPENVMVTDRGHVKILDFGIAKILDPARTGAALPATQVETAAPSMTVPGAVIGTVPYMAPEQVRGAAVDARTDLWALGCILYEMLAGRPAFSGGTASDVMAAILTRDPDWGALPAAAPAELKRLIARCLAREPDERLRDAAAAAAALADADERLHGRPGPGLALRWGLAGIAILAIAAVGLLAIFTRSRGAAPPAEGAPFPVLSQVTFGEGVERFPAFSPDGASLAHAASSPGGRRRIVVRDLARGEDRTVTSGAADEIQPAWSPDGRTLLFVRAGDPARRLEPGDVFGAYEGGDVWALDLATGAERRLFEEAFNPAWSPDGSRIAADASWAGPRRIWVLDAAGRNPEQVSTDVSEAVAHLRPRWSPDGRKIVFQNLERTTADVRVVDLASKAMTWVTEDPALDLDPIWSVSGDSVLFSSYRSGGLNIWRVPVSPAGAPAGPPRQVTAGAGQDVELAASPDGSRIAFAILKQNADLWRLPVSPEGARPTGPPEALVATTREDSRGSWSPDGSRIAFNSDRSGEMNIWVQAVDGGPAEAITKGPGGDYQPVWAPDGSWLAFFSSRGGHADIWRVDLATKALTRLTSDPSIEINPAISPDGAHIAYQSDRGGRLEVWVMRSDGTEPRALTADGVVGHFLAWTKEPPAVVFRCACGGRQATFAVPPAGGPPVPLGDVRGGSHMSFSPDGSAILDVVGHRALWLSPLKGGAPEAIFQFDEADARIDYPVWSPDGRWVLMDRFRPEGGDVWMMERRE